MTQITALALIDGSKFAVDKIFEALSEYFDKKQSLQNELIFRQKELDSHDLEDIDDIKEQFLHKLRTQTFEAQKQHELTVYSIELFSSSLLQLAKQLISISHGQKVTPPRGRDVHSIALSEVIWEARNQTMHYDDDDPRSPVKSCFSTLSAHDPIFKLGSEPLNKSAEIVKLLGWKSFDDFKPDLLSIL